MTAINDHINTTAFKGLQVNKLLDIDAKEILQISLEDKAIFPKHTSPRDATLLVLEGSILFFINDKAYSLKKHQILNFSKDEEHWVEAHENSKFLIIR
jgi:quercetin dioxygenase-like cupin family protein